MNDYENRFRVVVRKFENALVAVGAIQKMPSEVYGWLMINVFMRLEASDAANVRGKAASYKLDDVTTALNLVWSSGSLAQRDAETRRRKKDGQSYLCEQDEHEIHQVAEQFPDEDYDDEDETSLPSRPATGNLAREASSHRLSHACLTSAWVCQALLMSCYGPSASVVLQFSRDAGDSRRCRGPRPTADHALCRVVGVDASRINGCRTQLAWCPCAALLRRPQSMEPGVAELLVI